MREGIVIFLTCLCSHAVLMLLWMWRTRKPWRILRREAWVGHATIPISIVTGLFIANTFIL